jgi:hypothetical protein
VKQFVEALHLIPDYDPRAGEHYWIVTAGYRINPATAGKDGPLHLDRENLVHLSGTAGCYYCERAYEPRLLLRRCPGDPRRRVNGP